MASETKTNLRTYLMEKINDGAVQDLCNRRGGSINHTPLIPLIQDLITIAKEAGDKDLEDFLSECQDGSMLYADSPLFGSGWPEPKGGPELDLKVVESIAKLEEMCKKTSEFMKQFDSKMVKRYFPCTV
jgi:hypothetical protein